MKTTTMNNEKKKKKKSAFGVVFSGEVTFHGPMFDIHDNEHVHLQTMKCPQMPEEMDETVEMSNDITAPPEEEELNYFQPKLHLKRVLMMDWFELCRADKRYNKAWREGLVDGLLECMYRDDIAREWAMANRKDAMKGYLMGILKDTGVLKGSYDSISLTARIMNNTRTFSRYMSRGKTQKWYPWVADYVKNSK
jgi:hypothetical protein